MCLFYMQIEQTLKLDSETEQKMLGHVRKYKESGLSQIEYCRMNRLSYTKLIYWLKKSRQMDSNN
jgi:hypothetical protein